jgi:hypothetical protein
VADSSTSPRAGLRSFLEERALLSLIGAALWVTFRFALDESAPAAGAQGAVALTGCAFTSLLLVALCWGRGASLHADTTFDASGRSLSLGLVGAALPIALLAYWIREHTHHRPLGAVTFAVLATAVALFGALLARRLLELRRLEVLASAGAGRALSLGLLAAVVVAAWLIRPALAPGVETRAVFGDAVLVAVLGVAVVRCSAPGWLSKTARAAPVLALCLWLSTTWLIQSDAQVRAAVKSAPVVAGVLGLTLR